MEEKIIDLLDEKFAEEEFKDCYLVELNHSNKRIEVFVDSDSGMTLEKCQRISRYLENYLDEEKPLGDNYVLEVSSPGVGRPLRFWRQYPPNVGRTLEVTLENGDKHTGKLLAVEPHHLLIEEKVRQKVGKRKKTEIVQQEVPFDAIKKAVVKVSF